LAASLGLLAWLAWWTDWGQLVRSFAQLRIELWLLGVGLYAATQVASSLRWALLARPLGFSLPWRRFVSYYFIGMFFNLVLPTSVGGDVVRAWYLNNRSGRSVLALLSVLVDRGSGLLVLLILACLAVVLCPIPLPALLPGCVLGLGGMALAALVFVWFLVRRGVERRPGTGIPCWELSSLKTPGSGWRSRVTSLISSLVFLQITFGNRRGLVLSTTLLSVAVQVANVVLLWLIGLALRIPIPGIYYWILVPVVTLLTLLPISLNGMGVREGGIVLLLQPLGVGSGLALTLAFLWFATFTIVSLSGVVFYLWGRHPRLEVHGHDGIVSSDSDQGRAGQLKTAA
jgi:uncharacterized protein (TIRG00374 family)